MRKFTKLLSTLLASAMLMSFAGGALAAVPSDVVGTTYEEPAKILGALEIMVGDHETGNFRPDDSLRRSEFAKVAVATLGLSDVAAGSNKPTQYPDVVSNHWANGFINVATNQGLIIGDENGNFRPDDSLSFAEAITVLVRMLGYEPVAETKGSWPTGYLVTASEIGLTKGISSSANEAVKRGMISQLVYNALTINLMEQTGYGENVNYEVVDKTLLEDNLDVTKVAGQVVANEYTRLDSTNGINEDEVQIGDDIYQVGSSDVAHLLGYNVSAYIRENDIGDEEVLVAIAESNKNQTVEIDAENIKEVNDSGKKYIKHWRDRNSSNSVETSYIADNTTIIYNGKYADYDVSLLQPEVGSVKLLDADRDGIYEIAFVTAFSNYVVDDTAVSSQTISDKYGKPALKLDPESDIKYSITKDGEDFEFQDLKEWHVLSVTESLDKMLVSILVSDASVTGTVTEADEESVSINGESYEIAENYTVPINVQDEGTFYLDIMGKIAAVDSSTSAAAGNFAYLMNAAASGSISSDIEFKLFTSEGETKILTGNSKIMFNGSSKTAQEVLTALTSSGAVTAQMVTYDVNADNKITKLNTAVEKAEYNNNVFTQNFKGDDVVYKSASKKLGKYNVNEDTIVFDIPAGETDSENYAIRNMDMFVNESNYNVAIYNMAEDLTAKVVLVTNSTGRTSAEAPIAVVDKIAKVTNDRGEDVEKVYVYYKGEYVAFQTDRTGVLVKDGSTSLQQGDIIQFNTNTKGEIDTVNVLFDVSKKTTEFDKTDENLQTIYGKVDKKFTSSINVTVNDGELNNYSLTGVTIYEYDSSKNQGNIRVASAADIERYDDQEQQRVFIRIFKDEVKEIVIVK